MKILAGHTSPETAFIVDDYPYGLRLRCRKRYWLEYHQTLGTRLVSQATDPKRPDKPWNKPKASTYFKFGGCMYLDENEHVQWSGLSEFCSADEALTWREKFGAGVPGQAARELLDRWCAAKVAYEADREKQRQAHQAE